MRCLLSLLLACSGVDDDGGTDRTPTGPPEAPTDVASRVLDIPTVVEVTWVQPGEADRTWLAFEWAGGSGTSPPRKGTTGAHREVLLGVPSLTDVSFRVIAERGGTEVESEAQTATTGALPASLPEPALEVHDPDLASPEPWMLFSIDGDGEDWYDGPYHVAILDRAGRIVWFTEVPSRRTTMYAQPARAGTHLTWEETSTYDFFSEVTVLRSTTLDGRWEDELLAPGLVYAWVELPGGVFLKDNFDLKRGDYGLAELAPDGTHTPIWSCADWLDGRSGLLDCYTNTVTWDQATDTVMWSMPPLDTVLQIDRAAGAVLHEWGPRGGWSFDPADAAFDFNHYPHLTPDGTLLVSSHAGPGGAQQRAREYRIDAGSQTLEQVWSFGDGIDDYAIYSGEAVRLPNGNTLINYGTGGAAREVTADGEIAWHIAWSDELLTGHGTLIADLYALNEGPDR